ncbi:AAA-ATPase-like protein [Cinnamomum micranthum f. kanehirae]|uniref:AAA-ATPase-like protein n=1 Tax=Cinnamomum micranthum f. kanehirae TaxID=337451 RepID=A0A3S3MAJ2_9MAGN|nr:AAA-ATPase-like protein [Cinnamomum micranthum f. kanehirae]
MATEFEKEIIIDDIASTKGIMVYMIKKKGSRLARLAAREIAEILSQHNIGRAGRKILRSIRSIQIHDHSAIVRVLNFIDGMSLSCRDARIFIFSTNNNEQLDCSFLHMDMCIHMSYLKASAFIILASNCLGIEDHQLFEEIQKLLMTVEVTPRTYE